jgi:hypothetical protein
VVVLNRMVPTILVLLLFVQHFLNSMGVGMTLTGFWSQNPYEASATWAVQTGDATSQRQTGTVKGHLLGAPFRLSSLMYGGGQPWDTYVTMFLWLWCGWLWLRTPAQPPPTGPPLSIPTADVVLMPLSELATDETRITKP